MASAGSNVGRRPGGCAPVEVLELRRLLSTTFTVLDTLDDAAPGSLRWAIGQVNADATDAPTDPDVIAFAIPATDPGFNAATGTWSISPASALPTITGAVVIDGDSQPGSSQNTLAQGDNAAIAIRLDGAKAGASVDGLAISGGSSLVRGLSITDFNNGIHLEGPGVDLIAGDFVGLDADGTTLDENADFGVFLDGTPAVTIGGTAPGDRDLIAASSREGLTFDDFGEGVLASDSAGDVILGSYFGTDRTGTVVVGASNGAVRLRSSPGATVGGPAPADANVLTGTNLDGHGVSADGDALIQGNRIGTDVTGTKALGNGSGVVVGPNSQVLDNLISGGSGTGIDLAADGILVQGNLIGTDVTGTKALGNGSSGIYSSAGRNTIGGAAPGRAT